MVLQTTQIVLYNVKSRAKGLKRLRTGTYSIHTSPLYDSFGKIVSREHALKALNLDPSFRYLLFFGFIREYKGLDWLLEAFADEGLRQFPVKLIVAGEFYTSAEKYYQIIKEKKLSDHIILRTDFIADNEVAYYFGASDMIVQPYKSATQSGVTQIAFNYNKPICRCWELVRQFRTEGRLCCNPIHFYCSSYH
jgi:glycosyltransferase involved in cell wall biosynthesis